MRAVTSVMPNCLLVASASSCTDSTSAGVGAAATRARLVVSVGLSDAIATGAGAGGEAGEGLGETVGCDLGGPRLVPEGEGRGGGEEGRAAEGAAAKGVQGEARCTHSQRQTGRQAGTHQLPERRFLRWVGLCYPPVQNPVVQRRITERGTPQGAETTRQGRRWLPLHDGKPEGKRGRDNTQTHTHPRIT